MLWVEGQGGAGFNGAPSIRTEKVAAGALQEGRPHSRFNGAPSIRTEKDMAFDLLGLGVGALQWGSVHPDGEGSKGGSERS